MIYSKLCWKTSAKLALLGLFLMTSLVRAETGFPLVEAKPVPKLIYLKYAYAPGVAVLLQNRKTGVKGTALLHSQVEPWSLGGVQGGGFGTGNNLGGRTTNTGLFGVQGNLAF